MPHDPNMVLGEDCNLQCKKDKSNTKVAQVNIQFRGHYTKHFTTQCWPIRIKYFWRPCNDL